MRQVCVCTNGKIILCACGVNKCETKCVCVWSLFESRRKKRTCGKYRELKQAKNSIIHSAENSSFPPGSVIKNADKGL